MRMCFFVLMEVFIDRIIKIIYTEYIHRIKFVKFHEMQNRLQVGRRKVYEHQRRFDEDCGHGKRK